jgi:hypothetical protein
MHQVAGELAQIAIYYPHLACAEALRADNEVVSTPNGVSPTLGMVKQTCQNYP